MFKSRRIWQFNRKAEGIHEFSEKAGVSSYVMTVLGWSRLLLSSWWERISIEDTQFKIHYSVPNVIQKCGSAAGRFLSWGTEQQFSPGTHKAARAHFWWPPDCLNSRLSNGSPLSTPTSPLGSYKYLNNYFFRVMGKLYQLLLSQPILLAEQLSTIIAAFHHFLFH